MSKSGYLLDKFIAHLSYFGAGMGVLSAIALVALISLNVLLRYFFNKPYMHTFELSAYLFIVIAYLGFAYAVRTEAHINVDFVVKRFPVRLRGSLDIINMLVALLVILIYLWFTKNQFWQSLISGRRAWTTLETPLWIPQLLLLIGLSLFSLEIVARLIRKIVEWQQGAATEFHEKAMEFPPDEIEEKF